MKLFRIALMSGLVLALCGASSDARAQAPAKMITVQMPATPDPARVTLDPKTTALVVLDYVEDICNTQVNCKTKMLPAVTDRPGVPSPSRKARVATEIVLVVETPAPAAPMPAPPPTPRAAVADSTKALMVWVAVAWSESVPEAFTFELAT